MTNLMEEGKIFYRLGDQLCLDFMNTVGFHAGENPNEWLTSYERLVLWSWEAGALDSKDRMDSLLNRAKVNPQEAQQILNQCIDLREAIYRIYCAVVEGEPVHTADISMLNSQLIRSSYFLTIKYNDQNEFFLGFNYDTDEMDCMVWPIVKSAVELLTSKEMNKVKKCEGGTCGWLFIDTSRNRSRRWCSMEDCGNRAKARRHYKKKKGQK